MKPRQPKLKISWARGAAYMMNIDFGKFPAPEKNKIKVDADMWQEYVRVRMRFEELHQELFNKTRRP